VRSVKEYEEGNRKSIELQCYGDILMIKLIEYDLWLASIMQEEAEEEVDVSVEEKEREYPF
jgi:hypothetical protein